MAAIDDEFSRVLAGLRRPGRPDVGQLYGKLANLTAAPVDLSPLKAVAAANQEGSQRDFLGGLALSALGGRRLSRTGQDLAREGLERGKPLRPNAADVGYENPETGEIVANPSMQRNQDIKAVETQIKGVESAEAKENAVAARIIAELERNNRHEDAMELKRLLGMGMLALGNRRVDNAEAAAAAKAAKPPKGQEPPSAIQTKLLENQSNYDFISEALREGKKYPDAFGFKTFFPSEAVSRVDKKGVTARAFVQNISSLKIHDRSGAAVTAAEFPRLKPFIPAAGDPWDVVEEKLKGFQKEYGIMKGAIARGWPNSALVNNLDKRPGAAPPAAPSPASGEGWVEVSPGVRVRAKAP